MSVISYNQQRFNDAVRGFQENVFADSLSRSIVFMRRKWTRPSMMATWEILIPSPVCTSSHSMRSLSNLNSLDYRICCLTSSFQIRNFVEEILMAGWSPAVNLHAIPSTF